ncbi:hypothetical protein HHJ06_10985 [Akkermansia muciniphila]|nr:hypothetical protein [Akkermansia muciniphila]
MPQHQQGRFPRAEGKRPVVFPPPHFPHAWRGRKKKHIPYIRAQAGGTPFSPGNSGVQPPSCKPFHSKSPRFPETSLSFIFKSFFTLSNWTWQENCVMMAAPLFS